MENIIWRCDDVSCFTDLNQFKMVQDLFDKYEVTHTIALICKDIKKAPELIEFIKSKDIKVEIHCYTHIDYSIIEDENVIAEHLLNCISIIYHHFGTKPTTWFTPWNRSSPLMKRVAKELDLEVSTIKVSLPAYIRAGGGIGEGVVNYHSWAAQEVMYLEQALKMYQDRQIKCI